MTPEFQSPSMTLEKLSRRERLRVLGVQAVCAGLRDVPAESVMTGENRWDSMGCMDDDFIVDL